MKEHVQTRRGHQTGSLALQVVCAEAGKDLLVQVRHCHTGKTSLCLQIECFHMSSVACICSPVVGHESQLVREDLVSSSATVQDSIPRGVIEVRDTRCLSAKATLSARLLTPVWARDQSLYSMLSLLTHDGICMLSTSGSKDLTLT